MGWVGRTPNWSVDGRAFIAGFVSLAVGWPAVCPASGAAHGEQEIVLLLDRSGSMVSRRGQTRRTLTFEQAIGRARAYARTYLQHLDCAGKSGGGATVSLFEFSDQDDLRLFPGSSRRMSPRDALGHLEQFFTLDTAVYSGNNTYIRKSIFELTRQVLELGDGFTPRDDIDKATKDASLSRIFVFTDGEESHRDGFDNRPYEAWTGRQSGSAMLHWYKWDVFSPPSPSLGEISYDVRLGQRRSSVGVYDPHRKGAGAIPLERYDRTIKLLPQVLPGPAEQDVPTAQDRLICRPNVWPPQSPLIAPSAAKDLLFDSRVEWQVGGEVSVTKWHVGAAAREVIACAEMGDVVDRGSALALRIRDAAVSPPSTDPEDGKYAVSYDFDRVCDALIEQYPNSQFLFRAESGALPVFGDVTVQRALEEPFDFEAQGMAPTGRLDVLEADWWHIYRARRMDGHKPQQATRTFALRARRTPRRTRYTIERVDRVVKGAGDDDGEDVLEAHSGPALEFAVLEARNGSRGTTVEVDSGAEVTLSIPPAKQVWWLSQLDLGFHPPAGTYHIRVSIQPLELPDRQVL